MEIKAAAAAALESGIYAGAVVFAVEAVDRAAALWPSFNSPAEPLVFALYLAPTILLGLGVGVAIGAALFVLALAHAGVRRLVARDAAAFAVTTGAIGLLAAVAIKAFPGALETPLFRFVKKIDGKLVSIDFVVSNFSWLLVAGVFVAVAIGLGLALAFAARPSPRQRPWRIAGAAVFLAAAVVMYGLDSRFLYGRYESVIHMPAAAGALAAAFVAAGFARGLVASRRAVGAVALAIVVFGALAFGFDLWHVGSNENLKALLWRRGVVARRAYQIASAAWDRDGDGFSPLFGGGDLDDRDASVHPLATEVPANGVDDNCVGGDAPAVVASAAPAAPAPAPNPAAPGAGKSLLFIAIDTLRANRMSAYGYHRPTSPRLAEWGARGRFFERAYAQGTNTGQTFASMQRAATRAALYDATRPTMFGRLAAAGYRTAQVNARRDDVWLDGGMWADYRRVILDGIAEATHQKGKPLWDADKVTDQAIEYLSSIGAGERHATWVHYLDPHAPRRKMAPFDWGDSDGDKYDTEVAFADREVGRLLDWMAETGRLDETIVVLMADHGEAFGDHGMVQHGNRPYDDQSHVPLMIWAPGVAPARVATPVGTIDIAPTVLGYLGMPPIPGAEGVDLLGEVPARPIFVETPRNGVDVTFFAYAVTDGRWRLIYDVVGNTTELYDLEADPGELRNLADREPGRTAELRAVLARWLDTTGSVRPYGASDDTGGDH